MSEPQNGTFSQLMELGKQPKPKPERKHRSPPPDTAKRFEDLATTPYNSQNYRFTDDELQWLRQQSFTLSARFGAKVTQNTVIRFAVRHLRDACAPDPDNNPLVSAIDKLAK